MQNGDRVGPDQQQHHADVAHDVPPAPRPTRDDPTHNGVASLTQGENGASVPTPSPNDPGENVSSQKKRSADEVNGHDAALASSPKRPRVAARPISPPWKKASAEGPTTVVIDGRRKSGRTNAVPPDPTPDDKRVTRGATKKASPEDNRRRSGLQNGHPSRSGGPGTASRNAAQTSTPTARQNASRAARTPRVSLNGPSSAATRRHGGGNTTATPARAPAATGSGRGRQVPPSHAAPNGRSQRRTQQTSTTQPQTVTHATRTPRLRLRHNIPPLPILHPLQIPRKQFSSFGEWWKQDDPFEGEAASTRMTEEQAAEDAKLTVRILDAAKPGGALSAGRCELAQPLPTEEPPPQYFQWDHLVAHAANFRMLLEREHRKHVQTAKKIAREAVREYNRRRPQTREELEEELLAQQWKRYKQLVKDVEKTWSLVAGEVSKRRMARYQEQEHEAAEQALGVMLDHSTQLLHQRTNRLSSELPSESAELDSRVDDEESMMEAEGVYDESGLGGSENGENNSEGEDEDDENMSSESAQDSEAESAADADASLTVEQLREKYGVASTAASPVSTTATSRQYSPSLPSMSRPTSPEEMPDDENLDAERSKPARDESGIDPANVVLDEVDDALMDDPDDESTDLDSDESISEGDSEELESESEEENPLLGFFSKGALSKATIKNKGMSPEPQIKSEENHADVADDASVTRPSDELDTTEEKRAATDITEVNTVPPLTNGVDASASTPREGSSRVGISESRQSSLAASAVGTPASSVKTPVPVHTSVPSLLRGTLREYQHQGLDWLAGLYAGRTNGILADEMGLGKTIQTIALLAHLAVDRGQWGPHLIVVPTSVMLNWEMEFKKWCPGFQLLVYYGSQEQRKAKRRGWTNDDAFNVCITSYQLALQDQHSFKQRRWHYLILDEAHNIKNFQTQRWQTLLGFNTARRLLLTGTPLQNNLSELWSLLFFIQGKNEENGGFAELEKFQSALRRPANQILDQGRQKLDAEAQAIVRRLHSVLRPYILRRLKAEVEKQMPAKYEHVIYCRLSKRQRQLYDEFMARADTRRTLASGNYMSIINCLMSLRKVCNHPNLFEPRQIVTSFAMPKSAVADYEIKELLIRKRFLEDAKETVSLDFLNLLPVNFEKTSRINTARTQSLQMTDRLDYVQIVQENGVELGDFDPGDYRSIVDYQNRQSRLASAEHLRTCIRFNRQRLRREPVYGTGLVERLSLDLGPVSRGPKQRTHATEWFLNQSETLRNMCQTLEERSRMMDTTVAKFACITPTVAASEIAPLALTPTGVGAIRDVDPVHLDDPFHEARTRLAIAFPDKRLLQYDCGKLQALDRLLRQLSAGGHRCLIFTQMTKVLDILEQFLNIHGHRYLRLDGATKIEQRQALTDRFNKDARVLAFILSSRSGGLGINLTGADTVIFYDLDWNPAMDAQCQDRCHRIGQTRDVHIYRLVSEHTIEANILRKSNQKRLLDDVIIQKGDFTTESFLAAPRGPVSYRDVVAPLDADPEDPDAGAAMDKVLGGTAAPDDDPAAVPATTVFASAEDEADRVAARHAGRELVLTDAGDFSDAPAGGDPAKDAAANQGAPAPDTAPADGAGENILAGADAQDGAEAEQVAHVGHVDEYMLRAVEWELRDVPLAPPGGRKNKSKRAPEHRGRRRR